MSVTTVQRALSANTNLFEAAKQHQHPMVFFFKNLFYKIFTFGLGESLYSKKDNAREQEIACVAKDMLIHLPHDFSKFNADPSFKKTLHINQYQGYEIALEGHEIVLYKVAQKNVPVRDENSRACLLTLDTQAAFNQFIDHLAEIKFHPVFDDYISQTINHLRQLQFAGKPLLDNFDDIAAQFVTTSDAAQVAHFFEKNQLGKMKFNSYEDYLTAKSKNNVGADDLMPLRDYLLSHHTDIRNALCELHLDSALFASAMLDKLEKENESYSVKQHLNLYDQLSYERQKLSDIHELLLISQNENEVLA